MPENDIAGIILAAGRGSRMKELTAEKPKCLLELAGKPLLHWQLAAMRRAGIEKILVVRGYAAHCLQGEFETVENPRWENTNMLSSLLCAKDFASDFFANGGRRLLISYSDIVDISRIQGQYIGLLSLDAAGWQILVESANELGAKVDKTDMTAFLRFMLSRQIPVGVVPVEGGWCECDNAEDIRNYENALASGCWSHDWR